MTKNTRGQEKPDLAFLVSNPLTPYHKKMTLISKFHEKLLWHPFRLKTLRALK